VYQKTVKETGKPLEKLILSGDGQAYPVKDTLIEKSNFPVSFLTEIYFYVFRENLQRYLYFLVLYMCRQVKLVFSMSIFMPVKNNRWHTGIM
jgi:hypothetical protein